MREKKSERERAKKKESEREKDDKSITYNLVTYITDVVTQANAPQEEEEEADSRALPSSAATLLKVGPGDDFLAAVTRH